MTYTAHQRVWSLSDCHGNLKTEERGSGKHSEFFGSEKFLEPTPNVCLLFVCTRVHTCSHTFIYHVCTCTSGLYEHICHYNTLTCVYVHVLHTCIYIYVHVYIYLRMYLLHTYIRSCTVCTCTCVYVYMYMYMYICVSCIMKNSIYMYIILIK